jgi:glycerophosphoryl diester phosphodiesterase
MRGNSYTRTILAHRGLWSPSIRQNSIEAISKASGSNFGIETDLRFEEHQIVISHDPVDSREMVPRLSDVLAYRSTIAFNIKEDGLWAQESLKEYCLSTHSFFFDGSVPEMLKIQHAGYPHALRMSEYETELPWKSEYLWLDSFEHDWWIGKDSIPKILDTEIFVYIVSPELHGREYEPAWNALCSYWAEGRKNVGICTDYPIELVQYYETN